MATMRTFLFSQTRTQFAAVSSSAFVGESAATEADVNFTPRGLEAVLRRAGFRITHHKWFSLRDNSPAWVSSLLPALDPIRRRMSGAEGRGVHLLYSALVMALLPMAVLEALCGRGGTLFVRAVKEGSA